MLNSYPAYKPTNISWLPQVPEEWEQLPITAFTTPQSIRGMPELPLLSVYRDYGVILKDSRDDNYNKPGQDLRTYKVVQKGNLVLNKMKTWQGSLGIAEHDGIVSPAYIVCKVNKSVNGRFIHYLLRCQNYIFEYNRLSYGVRNDQWDMRYEDFKRIPVFLPPIKEQTAIADFLDSRISQINTFISDKQKIIELLKEQKQAIINIAVTRGVNPNVKLRSSGIEYLGDIPEHWELKKLKYVAKIQLGNVDKKANEGEETILLCNYTDVYNNDFIEDSTSFMEATATETEIEKFILNKGDVLITKDSETPDDIANSAYVIKDFKNVICGYHLAQIRANQTELHGEYLYRLFQSKQFNSHFEVSANGVTRFGLSLDAIADVFIPLPGTKEQIHIAEHILSETNKINSTISKIEKEIALIQEYKTALIAEAVTGKIKVA